MCFSSSEYASPVWSRWSHAWKIDPVLNAARRAISGCLRPMRLDNLYFLCGRNCPPSHTSDGNSHHSLISTNKKTTLCHPLWTRSNQKETRIKTQLSPRCWTHWWQRSHSKTDTLAQPSTDNTSQALVSAPMNRYLQLRMRHIAHLAKPKSATDRDCTMLLMGFQWGWAVSVRMLGWTDYENLLVSLPILPQHCTHENLEQFNPRARSCAQHWAGGVV